MASISTYLKNKLLEHSLGKTSWTMPTAVYAALYTVAPTVAGGGTEVSGSGYARIATTWGTASAGSIVNSAAIRFPASSGAGAAWGDVVAVGLHDALTGGNLLWFGPTSATVSVGTGDDFQLAASALTVTLS